MKTRGKCGLPQNDLVLEVFLERFIWYAELTTLSFRVEPFLNIYIVTVDHPKRQHYLSIRYIILRLGSTLKIGSLATDELSF